MWVQVPSSARKTQVVKLESFCVIRVRWLFDYVQKSCLDRLKITFMLTVICEKNQDSDLYGLYIGEERETFFSACRLAEKKNITWLPKWAKKVVAWLDPAEFGSTWRRVRKTL